MPDMNDVNKSVNAPLTTAVSSSEVLGGCKCMSASRFFGLCHDRCNRVHTCKYPEAARSRLILARRAFGDAEHNLKKATERLKRAEDEVRALNENELAG